ncbi:D-aminoacyl-tRNA deacylase [Chlorobium ferrooxidans]|uniref:D-aminoacyl-tRNA deacylase n=1 Tax=Chlorobium ferrooxidans DSM 13031 TaxID=377431 RepID=Q0YUE2_9CHLB|nr:D-aminoacyl-tRNA deacylase [Chlorobium ferrooxidans]EAT60089.1 D-tyrosyl-tRNA(Tyr) deacylase [Chlorobium ferrooxidans DSM 13031]
MRAVVQRVLSASVSASDARYSGIGPGMLVLLGIAPGDGMAEVEWMCRKIAGLRIFNDGEGKMNLSLTESEGEVLVVSQFTLYADTSRGNRPGFSGSARFDVAQPLYESFIRMVGLQIAKPVRSGWYGADMQVALVNDGPVTLILDTPLST